MKTKTEAYVLGMNAINNFYSMLYQAMRESMPGAQISQSGAYMWRGYRIDEFKELAYGQYYCQIYPHNPSAILLQEGYVDPSYKATRMEKERGIKSGPYYYPFVQSDDLFMARFFHFNRDEQFAFLKSFVAGAVEKALIWQKSKGRQGVTKSTFQQGKPPRQTPVKYLPTFEKVGEEFLKAWDCQKAFFHTLEEVLNKVPGKQWVRPNASIHNFGFRGLRLKLSSSSVTSRWSIFFEDAGRLKFQIPKGRKNSYNLFERGYFDLSTDEQTKQLTDFGQASLGITL